MKVILSLLTGSLLVLSFPGFDQDWLAWGALVPLLCVCLSSRPLGAFALGFLSGVTALLGIFIWIFKVPGFRFYHALPLFIFYGLFPGVWGAGVSILRKRKWLVCLFVPTLWVALDYVKAHAGFLALPWATLAQSQYVHPAILQGCTMTGEYGLTFLIVLVNGALALAILRRTFIPAVMTSLLVGTWLVGGIYALHRPLKGPCVRVAVVQPAILLSERKTAEGRAASRRRLEALTRKAATFHPTLIVWPETAIRDLKHHPELLRWVQEIARETRSSLLIGASEFFKFNGGRNGERSGPSFEILAFNSACFISPTGVEGLPYHKHCLLPFGEYIPLASVVPWPGWLVPEIPQNVPGKTPRYFHLPDGFCVTPIICWENLFKGYVKRVVDKKANIVVQLVNDNWFGRTAAPEQHNMASVLRAVENRVPFVIASNTGPSEIIGPYGRILKKAPLFRSGFIVAEVSVRVRP